MAAIAQKAEEVGLDVFATGEHHNPPFVPSSSTTMLGYVAARTERLILSTATTLITTNDPVKIAEDYATSTPHPEPQLPPDQERAAVLERLSRYSLEDLRALERQVLLNELARLDGQVLERLVESQRD